MRANCNRNRTRNKIRIASIIAKDPNCLNLTLSRQVQSNLRQSVKTYQ